MKFKSIMIAALATFTLAACSDNGDDNGRKNPADEAKLTINVASDAIGGRATGNPDTDKIDNYTVFITNAVGEIEWKRYESSAASINDMEVTASASHVYIIANAGDLTSTIATKAQLDAYTATMTNAAANQFTKRWATGQTTSPLTFSQNAAGDLKATATIKLTFLAARITLTIKNNMQGYDPTKTDGSLVLKNVAVLNAVQDSKLFGSSLMPVPTNYLTGINLGGSASLWPTPSNVNVNNMYIDVIPQNDFSTKYYFYVFENAAISAGQFPTIVTLVGDYDNKPIYYPVHLASYETWASGSGSVTSVERGKSYDINITLSVDPDINGGDGGGTIDPTIPDGNVDIIINVELNDWAPIVLNKEF